MVYETSDLYLAAALIANGARRPDAFILEDRDKGAIVKVIWNYKDGDKIDGLVKLLNSNTMAIEPHVFRTIHIGMKKKALELVDGRRHEQNVAKAD